MSVGKYCSISLHTTVFNASHLFICKCAMVMLTPQITLCLICHLRFPQLPERNCLAFSEKVCSEPMAFQSVRITSWALTQVSCLRNSSSTCCIFWLASEQCVSKSVGGHIIPWLGLTAESLLVWNKKLARHRKTTSRVQIYYWKRCKGLLIL